MSSAVLVTSVSLFTQEKSDNEKQAALSPPIFLAATTGLGGASDEVPALLGESDGERH